MEGGRRGLFKRPAEDDFHQPGRVVKAKPIAGHIVRRLNQGQGFQGKDFVEGSAKSQTDFYGTQRIIDADVNSCQDSTVELTSDEKNKLSARILKAELKGKLELVSKLRQQLQSQVKPAEANMVSSTSDVLLTRVDPRTGLVTPVRGGKTSEQDRELAKGRMVVEDEFKREMDMKEMLQEEKQTSARDQIEMFDHLAKVSSLQKVDDDFVIDDIFAGQKCSRKHRDREQRSKFAHDVAAHKQFEQTLDSCTFCIDSYKLNKYCIVAVGLKTYLAIPPFESLVEGHCWIVPMMHVSSSLNLDEDVFEEMKIWRKGLTAMFSARDSDCIFVETAKNVDHHPHMFVECIPLPLKDGPSAPIYFKKALLECESDWSDNKKLVDLSAKSGDIRRAIPKGFCYFAVDFGLQSGYAHVIEDEHRFPVNFAKEIVGGMLDLEHNLWRRPKNETLNELMSKSAKMKTMWTPFDWTEKVKHKLKERDNGKK